MENIPQMVDVSSIVWGGVRLLFPHLGVDAYCRCRGGVLVSGGVGFTDGSGTLAGTLPAEVPDTENTRHHRPLSATFQRL